MRPDEWARYVACAVVAVVVASLPACGPGAKPPELDAGSVETVGITLYLLDESKWTDEATSTDAKSINALLAVVRSAESTRDHKCGDSGRVIMHTKDGDELKFGILPGHDPRYYEIRVYEGSGYGIFRVEREPFLKAMQDLGVKDIDLGRSE